jgi:hypothetical protein
VRIVLVAAEFGRELTTAVLWLNKFDRMDIRCVRLRPYQLDGQILLDIEQVIPLPEATDYQVRQRRKAVERERATADNRDWTRYVITVAGHELGPENKRNSIRVMIEQLVAAGIAPEQIAAALPDWAFRKIDGAPATEEEIAEAVTATTGTRADRYFLNHPVRVDGDTWLVSRAWGANVDAALSALASAFPQAEVGYRVAE